jgi:hypothetical protein
VLRHSDGDVVESALRDWRAVLTVLGDDPFSFGDEPTALRQPLRIGPIEGYAGRRHRAGSRRLRGC